MKGSSQNIFVRVTLICNFPGGSDGKQSACNAREPGSIPQSEDPLEKGMTTRPSILAWEISGTEKRGGLQSMGSQNSQTGLSDETARKNFFSVSKSRSNSNTILNQIHRCMDRHRYPK